MGITCAIFRRTRTLLLSKNKYMYYKILQKIEEKDSLPIGSLFEIDDEMKHIKLDSWSQIDIQFLLREKYIAIANTPKFRVWQKAVLSSDNYEWAHYGTIISIQNSDKWEIRYLLSCSFIYRSEYQYIYESELRAPTDLELWLYF